jgi:hypothetical protein
MLQAHRYGTLWYSWCSLIIISQVLYTGCPEHPMLQARWHDSGWDSWCSLIILGQVLCRGGPKHPMLQAHRCGWHLMGFITTFACYFGSNFVWGKSLGKGPKGRLIQEHLFRFSIWVLNNYFIFKKFHFGNKN